MIRQKLNISNKENYNITCFSDKGLLEPIYGESHTYGS